VPLLDRLSCVEPESLHETRPREQSSSQPNSKKQISCKMEICDRYCGGFSEEREEDHPRVQHQDQADQQHHNVAPLGDEHVWRVKPVGGGGLGFAEGENEEDQRRDCC